MAQPLDEGLLGKDLMANLTRRIVSARQQGRSELGLEIREATALILLGLRDAVETAILETAHALDALTAEFNPWGDLVEDVTPVEELELSVTGYNRLKREGVHTIGGLAERSDAWLLHAVNLNDKGLREVHDKLTKWRETRVSNPELNTTDPVKTVDASSTGCEPDEVDVPVLSHGSIYDASIAADRLMAEATSESDSDEESSATKASAAVRQQGTSIDELDLHHLARHYLHEHKLDTIEQLEELTALQLQEYSHIGEKRARAIKASIKRYRLRQRRQAEK